MSEEITEWLNILNHSDRFERIHLLSEIIFLSVSTTYTGIGDMDGFWCQLRQLRYKVVQDRQNLLVIIFNSNLFLF